MRSMWSELHGHGPAGASVHQDEMAPRAHLRMVDDICIIAQMTMHGSSVSEP